MTEIILTHLGLTALAWSLFMGFCTAVREADRLHGVFEDGEPW